MIIISYHVIFGIPMSFNECGFDYTIVKDIKPNLYTKNKTAAVCKKKTEPIVPKSRSPTNFFYSRTS